MGRLPYLTDPKGLPPETASRTREFAPELLVLDCSYPPQDPPSRNHDDLTLALDCIKQVNPHHSLLVHASHKLDNGPAQNVTALPQGVTVSTDNQRIEL